MTGSVVRTGVGAGVRVALYCMLLLLLTACSLGRLPATLGTDVADAEAFAEEIRRATLPASPEQITFSWLLDEQGSRARGRGVVRAEAPERIRLDLFGPRGETYLMAALVAGEYRLPPTGVDASMLPSPSLLWSAMGVVRAPPAAVLESATTDAAEAQLRYRTPGDEVFIYSFGQIEDGRYRLDRLERAGRQGVVETVTLERDPTGALTVARYRNWSEFRDLVLEIESIRGTDAFPPSTWRPDAASF